MGRGKPRGQFFRISFSTLSRLFSTSNSDRGLVGWRLTNAWPLRALVAPHEALPPAVARRLQMPNAPPRPVRRGGKSVVAMRIGTSTPRFCRNARDYFQTAPATRKKFAPNTPMMESAG